MSKKIFLIIIVSLFLGIGVGVYGGMQYGANKMKGVEKADRGNFGGGPNGGQRGGQGALNGQRANGGGFVNGDIVSKDDKSITVKSQDGSSKIIFFSDSTIIGKATTGSADDLLAGQRVMVNGKNNSDGTITAQNIQLRPAQPTQPGQ